MRTGIKQCEKSGQQSQIFEVYKQGKSQYLGMFGSYISLKSGDDVDGL